jgi:hypothetical protein
MKTILFAILLTFWTASFAQKFGVDLGYAYSMPQLKTFNPEYSPFTYRKVELKQQFFPNASLRIYFKLYKKLYIYSGLDLMRYQFRTSIDWSDPAYIDNARRYMAYEFHVPVTLRLELKKFKQKHALSVYGGMFFRFPFRGRESYYRGSNSYDSIPSNNHIVSVRILNEDLRTPTRKYANLLAGIHQSLQFTPCFHGYIDLQVKYMPGIIAISRFEPNAYNEPIWVENRFAFSISLGISLLKSEKEKVPVTDPTRLED